MAQTSLSRDANYVAVGGGVLDDGSGTIKPIQIASATGRLKVTAIVSGGGTTWYQDEVPSGTKNGSNVTFTLAHTPQSVLLLYLNGQYQVSGGNDYTLSGTTITMVVAPLSTDILIATYS